jgi:hypothetical protein
VVTNLLGRRVETADKDDIAEYCRGKVGYIVAADADETAFWLLIELADSGQLVTLEAQDCVVAP